MIRGVGDLGTTTRTTGGGAGSVVDDATTLVTVAHGTRKGGGNEVARQLTEAAADRLGVPATAITAVLSALHMPVASTRCHLPSSQTSVMA